VSPASPVSSVIADSIARFDSRKPSA